MSEDQDNQWDDFLQERLYSKEEAARYLGIELHHLHTNATIAYSRLPRIVLGPRCVRYRKKDLDAYIAAFSDPQTRNFPAGAPDKSLNGPLMSAKEAAEYLNISIYTIKRSKFFKASLTPVYIKSHTYFYCADVKDLMTRNTHPKTEDNDA